MRGNRQWMTVGIVVGVIVTLIGMGWFIRDRLVPVGMGSVAPDYSATDLAGNPVSLEDLKGEVVLLNIWATWCGPCREEMPSMQRLYEDYKDRGLHIVAVSVDAPIGLVDRSGYTGGDVEAFAKGMGLTFPIWLDPKGEIQQVYKSYKVPESFVIDKYGYIVTKEIGARDWNSPEVRELFDRLLEI